VKIEKSTKVGKRTKVEKSMKVEKEHENQKELQNRKRALKYKITIITMKLAKNKKIQHHVKYKNI
jgi:hypothetical protein